jgi:hypothetical protein
MCICIYVCMDAYVCFYVCVQVCRYVCVVFFNLCIHTYIHTYVYVYMYVYVMYVCIYEIYVCIYVCVPDKTSYYVTVAGCVSGLYVICKYAYSCEYERLHMIALFFIRPNNIVSTYRQMCNSIKVSQMQRIVSTVVCVHVF